MLKIGESDECYLTTKTTQHEQTIFRTSRAVTPPGCTRSTLALEMRTGILQAIVAAAFTLVACREKPEQSSQSSQTTLAPDANGSAEVPKPTNQATAEFEEIQHLMETLGVRSAQEGDVGFIESSMLEHQESGMNEVLKLLREGDVQLALPDQILLGVGVWSVSPDDFDRAVGILEREGIRERYPQLKIARKSATNHQNKSSQQDGAGEPATRSGSDTEGDDEPQPQSVGRFR